MFKLSFQKSQRSLRQNGPPKNYNATLEIRLGIVMFQFPTAPAPFAWMSTEWCAWSAAAAAPTEVSQEAKNSELVALQEKFHRGILTGVRNISDTL